MIKYQNRGFKIEIAFVIDATNGGALIDEVKDVIKALPEVISKQMDDEGFLLGQISEKLVFFGDYATEGENAIIETDFYDITDDNAEFYKNFEREDIRMAGGDPAENGLEALFRAVAAKWPESWRERKDEDGFSKYSHGRRIIIVFSDAYPLRLMERKGCIGYPDYELPPGISEFERFWNDDQCEPWESRKRLFLYVPQGMDYHRHTWEDVLSWQNAAYLPSILRTEVKSGGGLGKINVEALAYNLLIDVYRSL